MCYMLCFLCCFRIMKIPTLSIHSDTTFVYIIYVTQYLEESIQQLEDVKTCTTCVRLG
jgi:hypothetical protein